MKYSGKYFSLLALIGILVVPSMISHSCANTTEAPTGGDKDTIPPVIVKCFPLKNTTMVPREGVTFSFTFDEYVKIKNQQNIFVSPPVSKPLTAKIKGKSLLVTFEECRLDSATTYTIDFIDALADNNEGNVFPGFTYVFSTGEYIDSMMICGIVQDCNTLQPVKDATVLLYTDLSDSAVFKQRPFAATKSDDWGFFVIRNIMDTLYRLYAITDANNDQIYDPQSETVGFCDTVLRPSKVVDEEMPELQKYDMKDTLKCQARKPQFELNIFKEKQSRQYIDNKGRTSDRRGFVSFSAPMAHVDSLWIRGISPDKIISQFNADRDSLEIWANDRREMPDTFHLFVNYRKTDTLGVLVSETEELKLPHPLSRRQRRSASREIKKEDTTCVFKIAAEPERIEQYGFEFSFDNPIINQYFDSVRFTVVNPRQQESPGAFHWTKDTTDIKKYTVWYDGEYLAGYEYKLFVPAKAFRDINGSWSDSLKVSASLPTDETLSSISLELLSLCGNTYIVDLLNESKNTVIRSYVVNSEKTLAFPYLKEGNYYIRITEDRNHNGLVDTGDLLAHRQPEKVMFYKVDDEAMLKVVKSTEIQQSINLEEMFK